ncbi:MAG TPA: transglutaminase domain-containing protein [Chitinophagaceae bacterium]
MKSNLFLFLACLFGIAINAFSQDKSSAKFGNVRPEDFKTSIYSIDSNAAAIIIADVGSSEFIGNSKGNFSLLFKNYRRAHILNKTGYDISEVVIELYNDGTIEEELDGLKAVTYNLENGKVVATKLDTKTSVFADRENKYWTVKKFTFPNVREGSIIEYEYKVKSDFIHNLRPWNFQGSYPRLWSEYNVAMPEFFNYVTLTQGYQAPFIKTQKNRREHYIVNDTRGTGSTDRASFTAGLTDYRWVMKDVPMIREEKFTSTISNHISRIEFQLAAYREPFAPKTVMSTWENVAMELLEDENFGLPLRKDNGWLSDIVNQVTKKSDNDLQKARNIYHWVRDNVTCTQHSAKYLSQPLKNILKNKNGNVAEVNLLLTAMLIKADLQADPVILSTREHGYTHSFYPLLDRFNYVISRLKIGESEYFLDASETHLPFGKLDYECYNGHARVINKEATPVELNADLLKESSVASIFIINDDKGNSIGSYQKSPGFYESIGLRNFLQKNGRDELEKSIKKNFGSDVSLTKLRVDSLEKLEAQLSIGYDFQLESERPDVLYLNPMFGEGYKENPYKSVQRFYPIEMPFKIDEIFTLQIEVPKGYVVEEMPKSLVVKANEAGDAAFEYRLSQTGSTIVLRSRLSFQRTWFSPEEYEILREFYSIVVKKHNEQIVFKKKN